MDVVLERVAGRSEVLPLRFLDSAEKLDSLPAWLRNFTVEEQRRSFIDRMQSGTQSNREQAESACRLRQDAAGHWATLEKCLERDRELNAQLGRLDEQIAHLAATIERDADSAMTKTPFAEKMAEWRHCRDAALNEFDVKLRTLQESQIQCDKESADLAARVAQRADLPRKKEASIFRRFLGNLFNGRVIQDMESLVTRRHTERGRRD